MAKKTFNFVKNLEKEEDKLLITQFVQMKVKVEGTEDKNLRKLIKQMVNQGRSKNRRSSGIECEKFYYKMQGKPFRDYYMKRYAKFVEYVLKKLNLK